MIVDTVPPRVPRLFVGLLLLLLGAFFGSLALGAQFFPQPYDWRYRVISNLLSPRDNPYGYWIPAAGITLTGLLLLPFAGFLGRSLAAVSRLVARFSQGALIAGSVCLICAGFVVPQHTHPVLGFTRLHEILARSAAAGFALTMLGSCWCAWQMQRHRAARSGSAALLAVWSAVTLLPLAGIFLSESLLLIGHLHVTGAARLKEILRHTIWWHLGFWEWTGAVAFYLFLAAAVFLLPAAVAAYSRPA